MPADYAQVNAELHDAMESKADQTKAETQKQFFEKQRQSSSSAFPPPPPNPPPNGGQRGGYAGYGGAAGSAGGGAGAKGGFGAYGKYQGAGPGNKTQGQTQGQGQSGGGGAGTANGRRPPSSGWDDDEKFEYYKVRVCVVCDRQFVRYLLLIYCYVGLDSSSNILVRVVEARTNLPLRRRPHQSLDRKQQQIVVTVTMMKFFRPVANLVTIRCSEWKQQQRREK